MLDLHHRDGDRIDSCIAADLTANAQLVLHEQQGGDRVWERQMRDCWEPADELRIAWFQGIAAHFIYRPEKMADRGDLTGHLLSAPVGPLGEP